MFPNLGWQDVPIRSMLEKELGIPVYVENDANAAALFRSFGMADGVLECTLRALRPRC